MPRLDGVPRGQQSYFVPPQGFAAQLGHTGAAGALGGLEASPPRRMAAPPVPEPSLFDLGSNRTVDLSKFAGNGPLLVHFWGQTEPSRERLQDLDRIQTHHANDGVQIVGIAVVMTPGDEVRVKRQFDAMRLAYPVLLDRKGRVTLQTFEMDRWKQGLALFDRDGAIQAAVKIPAAADEAKMFALAHDAIHELVHANVDHNGSRDLGTGDGTVEIVVAQPDGRTPAANIEVRLGKPTNFALAKTDKYGRILLERVEMNPTTGRFAVATKAGMFVVDSAKSVPVFFFQGGTEVARGEVPLASEKRLRVAVTLKSAL